ncbi:hypothetical protein AXX17_ATUG01290 [Arabidopsis thaliana]|uniref:DUF4216 domain-containing protein n=1 Tax=Arabidopsis thaliana TaxID=3702 RepID=A0A178U802_ARATH|nr:hypothetical protein AXX17_ATUG01290 [Arabidopsis thaliana]
MDKKYKTSCWSIHGEKRASTEDSGPQYETEAFDLFKTVFSMGEGEPNQTNDDQGNDDEAVEETEFRQKLREAETPLYSDCIKYTKVSAIMGLYRFKVKSGVSETYFDQLLDLIQDMLSKDNVLPKSLAAIKRFLKIFGFGYENIHACKNNCILYRKEFEKLDSCPRCKVLRWEMDKHSNEIKVGIPAKGTEDGTMRHPVDSISWAQVNDKCPDFAAEPRNLRLGISTDGMNPFSMQNTNHSTWPVLLVNYNTAPTMCMKAENIMLSLLIPGPTTPGNNIDVYLAPLIDDLKDLWAEGIEVYDSFAKENFTLRAMLLWSISDYPALGTLSRCKVKGKQACNVCGKDTPSRWLKFSRKFVYMGNRKRLPPGHRYRYRKAWFDNTVEEGNANRIQTSAEIYETLQAFRNDFGKPLDKENKRKRTELEDDEVVQEEECEESNDLWRWKKRSIFFELPYWKDLPVRHNIDVMHVEKNVSDAILSILMQSAKSKDGLKARKDLEDIGIRNNLHTEVRGKKTYLPPAAYWLSKKEKTIFCKRLSMFRGSDGYCVLQLHDQVLNLLGQINSDSTNYSKETRWLAFGPRNVALAHKGFIVNGQRFHIDAIKRKTQNSGVTYEAFSMCRSSARDMRQVADMLTYYGVIKEILHMDYHMFKVPLFRCNWANTGNGVKEEDGFTLVNLHMNQTAYLKDPFILPSQAKQVFYPREDDDSN